MMSVPDYETCRCFERLIRLIGLDAFNRLQNSHVMIVGIGGVGSWAAESLVRTGIGHITLVDFDKISPSNLNRQLPASSLSFGRPKAMVMAERLRLINPKARIDVLDKVYSPHTAEEILLSDRPDGLLDAIDNITYKCHLLASARRWDLTVVCSTGAAGRLDPTQVRIADLGHTKVDPVATQVRKKLRKDFGFPNNRSFHIPAVYSEEAPLPPVDTAAIDGFPAEVSAQVEFIPAELCRDPQARQLDEWERPIPDKHPTRKAPAMGTASFVTGAFGLAAASHLVKLMLAGVKEI